MCLPLSRSFSMKHSLSFFRWLKNYFVLLLPVLVNKVLDLVEEAGGRCKLEQVEVTYKHQV